MNTRAYTSDGLWLISNGIVCARHSHLARAGYWRVWPPATVINFFGATSASAVVDDYGNLVRVDHPQG